MMKKLFTIFLTVILIISMAACNKTPDVRPTDVVTIPTSTDETTVNEEPTETEAIEPTETESTNETNPDDVTEPVETESPTETTAPHEHDYDATTVDATCTNDGYTSYSCACGDSYKDSYVDALGHKWSDWKTTKEATEQSEGVAERICSACNAKDTKSIAKIVKDHEHKYTDKVTTAATCVTEGVRTFTCSCGNSYTESIARVAHSYSAKVVDPTCVNGGYTEHVCAGCNNSYRDTYTNAVGHKYNSAVTKEATCAKTGVLTYTCTACGHKYTEEIAKTTHSYSDTVTEPACSNEGYTTHKCKYCGDSYVDNKVAALGHVYTDIVVSPTCTEKGYTKRACSRCAHTESTTEIAATGHSYSVVSNTATCGASGTKTEECSACGHQKTSTVPASGHQNTKVERVEAGCGYEGYENVVCSDCGTVISSTTIPSLGVHAYEEIWKLSEVAKYWDDRGVGSYFKFVNYTDWVVDVCKNCKLPNMDTARFAYSSYDAAAIMLGYVNGLRESVYGTSDFNLTLDGTLIELAKIRAKEISTNFSHNGGTFTNAGENIVRGGPNIYDHFSSWCNSSGHYQNMLYRHYRYFGYAIYSVNGPYSIHGVQLFWTPDDRAAYGIG